MLCGDGAVRILKAIGVKPRRRFAWRFGWRGAGVYGSLGTSRSHRRSDTKVVKPSRRSCRRTSTSTTAPAHPGIHLQGNEAVRPIFEALLKPFNYLGATSLTTRNHGGTDHLISTPSESWLPVRAGPGCDYDSQDPSHRPRRVRVGRGRRPAAGSGGLGEPSCTNAAMRAEMLPATRCQSHGRSRNGDTQSFSRVTFLTRSRSAAIWQRGHPTFHVANPARR